MANGLMITVDDDELFDLMCTYGAVEDKLRNFLLVLNALKDHYDDGTLNDMYATLSMIIGYLEVIQTEFAKTISRTDEFLLKQKSERK